MLIFMQQPFRAVATGNADGRVMVRWLFLSGVSWAITQIQVAATSRMRRFWRCNRLLDGLPTVASVQVQLGNVVRSAAIGILLPHDVD